MPADRRQPRARERLGPGISRMILEHLGLAVFVFSRLQLDYANAAARRLLERIRKRYNVEFLVVLVDHLKRLQPESGSRREPVLSMLSAPGGEPFHLLVAPVSRSVLSVTVREVSADLDAFRAQYRLSARETEVAELVARGYTNRQVAITLGIAAETAKKHLRRVYEKVGVESRVQLANRLA